MSAAAGRSLATQLKAQAYAAGFDLAGTARLGAAESADQFDSWLAAGFAGTMAWMERNADIRRDSSRPAPGMQSALVVGLNYGGTQPTGAVARYARGGDYHRVMWDLLDSLGVWLKANSGGEYRSFVDTGPVLERDLARRAGLGWFGKNTTLINPRLGSFFFIGALFTDQVLEPDAPFEDDRCGTCRRCLDACPTDALTEPRVLDSNRCISYLTIELRDEIPETLRPQMAELVYGCDICQDVCPWNVRFSRDASLAAMAPNRTAADPDLAELLALDNDGYRRRFRGTAITRAKRVGLARNAAVAMGNRRAPHDVGALASALMKDPEPLVRAHAAWALGQFAGDQTALGALEHQLTTEADLAVLREVESALVTLRSRTTASAAPAGTVPTAPEQL
ncbi:MAG: tRNA epoxyqueuosine(34) reductase QueG [Gemmatimonadetes bacterium]|nr:tRNA epoxyqueuosine(34) reductase QueG [Gemmatimonadota bacterium]